MSRFFQNFEEEKKETKKKTLEVAKQNEIKLSKVEMKLKEIEEKVEEIQKNEKNFEKLFKKFMSEIKKYSTFFDNEIPNFILDLFEHKKVKGSKQMKILVDNFLADFNKKEEEIVIKKESKETKGKLEDILLIDDDKEKEQILSEMFEKTDEIEKNCEIGISLFTTYSRVNEPKNMITILIKLLKYINDEPECDNSFTKILKKNIDIYLGKIYDILTNENYDFYLNLLDMLKNVNYKNNSDFIQTVTERTFEFDFFKKEKFYITNNFIFDLLFYIKNNNYERALELYNSNNIIFDKSKRSILILFEFSKFLAKNNNFDLSFKILCSENFKTYAFFNYKIELFSLCVILSQNFKKMILNNSDELKNFSNEITSLNSFLDEFKRFDSNYLLLESEDLIFEIFRAFFYCEKMDFKECSKIIKKVSNFDAEDYLKEQIEIN